MINKGAKERLKDAKIVAIIGCSENEYRSSHHIAGYLQEQGIQIVPVNPAYGEVLGEKCYSSIAEIPEGTDVDIVDIFRESSQTAQMVREAIDWAEKSNTEPLIWTQLDVSSPEAKTLAEEAGLDYVENECIMVQHRKLDKPNHSQP